MRVVESNYHCPVCNKYVPEEIIRHLDNGEPVFSPVSLYWNKGRQESYCSPEHSLERHEGLRKS